MTELLSMQCEMHGATAVWTVRGEIDLASAGTLERRVLDDAASMAAAVVVVDLAAARYLDSAGLAALVRIHTTLARSSGRLVLVAPHQSVARGTLTLAALDQVIPLFGVVDRALDL